MRTTLKVARILYEVIGGLAILLSAYVLYAFHGIFGMQRQSCVYSQVADVTSPDGKMIAERRLETCPYGVWVQIYLKAAEDEDVADTRVISLGKMDASRVGLIWTGANELLVTLPKDAPLLSAHSFEEGVTINRRTRD